MATRFIDVTFDNGETYTYEGVPFDATPEQAQQRIAKDFPDLIVSSIDGSRTSEPTVNQDIPSIIETARTAQSPVAAPIKRLAEDERVVLDDDYLRGDEVKIQQLDPVIKKAIEDELITYQGNPEFSQNTINDIYRKHGAVASQATLEYLSAMQQGKQVGGIAVGQLEAQQKQAEDAAVTAQAQELAKDLEGQGLFSREFEEASLYGFPGWVGRKAHDWMGTGKEELRKMYPGESEDWYERTADKVISQTVRALRQSYEIESNRNPAWRPDQSMIRNVASVHRWFPAVAGALLGSVGPESFIAPGASAGARIGSQAGISGIAELAYETLDYADDVNDGISGENILAATALGGIFQGGMEGLSKIIKGQRSGKDIEAEVNAGPQPTGELSPIVEEIVSPSRGVMPTEQVEIDFSFEPRQMEMDFNAPDLEARLAQEAADFRMRNTQQEATPESVFPPREEQLEMSLEAQPDLFRNLPEEAPTTSTERVRDDLDAKVEDLQRSVDYAMEDWKNAPETFVIRDYDDLADPTVAARLKQVDPEGTAKGVTLEDGSVAIIGKNIEGPEEVRAVLFHEALGHYGATQYFGNALDKNLEAIYNNSPSFREKVDEWMEINPGAYADRPDTIARAADEVLAEMSEGGKIDVKLMDRLKNVVKATLRRIGMQDIEYSDREIMTILGMMHDAVVKGTSVADNGFQIGPRFSNTREKKSLTPEKMKTKTDIDDLLEFVGEDAISSGSVSDVELGRMADDLGLTSSKYLKGKSLQDTQVAARLRGAHQVITNSVDELGALRERVDAEGMTPSLQASIRQKLGTLQALYARFDEDTAEVGRALRALRLVSESRQSSKAMDRFLRDADGLNLAADEESFIRFMNHMELAKQEGGAEAAGKFFSNARKMHWEDYAGSYIFNNMLSSPRTWAVNAGGGLMNHFIESFTLAARATLGAGYRAFGGKGESTHTNELIAQQMGALAGLWNYRTMADALQAFKRGEASGGSFSSKVGQTGTPISDVNNKAVKALGLVVENPRRVMAVTDEVWSAMFRMSELFRQAAHEVSKKGGATGNYWEDVKALAQNPTEEMLKRSNDYANEMLFRGNASTVTEGLAKMQKPRYEDEVNIKMRQDDNGKWVPYSRTVKEKDSQPIRVGKFGLRLMVPFAHTLDRIAATMLRNSGPLAVLTPTIRKQLKEGGIAREAALGRIVATSAMLSYFGFMAANGDITGADDPDYKKAFSLSMVTPPNSIRLGDEWMSYQGWDPLAGMMSAVSTAYQRSKGELSLETAAGLVSGFSEAMMKSTYAESLTNSMEMFQEVFQGVTSGEMDKKQATANFLAGQTANLIPVASFVRWLNQNEIDPYSRATKGDSSVADRMTNRLKAGIPFLSDDLPAKYDIFGREIKNPRQDRMIETDPVIKAVHEIDRNTDDIIFGAVSDRVKKNGIPQTKLTAAEHQEYQRVTGLFFYEDASTDISNPAWGDLTLEEKEEQLAFRYEEAKKYAREYLFPDPEEVEVEEEIVN